MGRRIYIIPKSMKVEDAVEDAKLLKCPEIVHGIPPKLEGIIDEASLPMVFEEPEPLAPSPPLCTHWAVIENINPGEEKPIRVKRAWGDKEYIVDCYVTEAVKDQYLAGDIAIGDYVLVQFLDDSQDRAIVFAKVLKG